MPIKKKLPTPISKPAESKPKATQKIAAPVKQPAAVAPKIKISPTEMGPPMDPATLPGANDHTAPSIAGQRYSLKYSTSPSASIWVFDNNQQPNTSLWVWRQCGGAVVFEYKTARYVGRFEGDVMRGTASNTSGASWTWEGTLAAPNASGMICYHLPL